MIDLFKSEFSRYKYAALAFYLVQVLVWVLVSRISFILSPGVNKYLIITLAVIIPGFLFGVLSMGLHSRKNNWAYLLHRPLSKHKIHLALTASAVSLLFIGFVLPLLSVVFALDVFTNNVVDVRHYLFSAHMFALVSITYFIGCFLILTPSKLSILAIWIISYLIVPNLGVASLDLALDLVFATMLFLVVRGSFNVNIAEFASGKMTIIISALILQPAILFILLISQALYYHLPLIAMGNHPGTNTESDFYRGFYNAKSMDAFAQVISASDYADKKSLLRQLTLSEFDSIPRTSFPLAHKGQLFIKDSSFAIINKTDNEMWVFSHDKMIFEGRNIASGIAVGSLTAQGFKSLDAVLTQADLFKAVPLSLEGRTIIFPDQIYRIDFEQQLFVLKHQLTKGEFYQSPVKYAFERVLLSTNKALHVIDQIDYDDPDLQVKTENVVPHPISTNRDFTIELTELLDGFLILYASQHYHGFNMPGAAIKYLQHDGNTDFLGSIEFPDSHLPALIEHQPFMFSPLTMNLVNGSLNSVAKFNENPPAEFRYFWQQRYDITVVLFALIGSLLSAVITFLLASKMPLSKSNRWTWTLLNLLLSIPGLVSFLILNSQSKKGDI